MGFANDGCYDNTKKDGKSESYQALVRVSIKANRAGPWDGGGRCGSDGARSADTSVGGWQHVI